MRYLLFIVPPSIFAEMSAWAYAHHHGYYVFDKCMLFLFAAYLGGAIGKYLFSK